MKQKQLESILVDIEIINRNLGWLSDKLKQRQGTQFESNLTESKDIARKIKTIKKKSADLSTI